jgi:arylsulfatase I/J
MTTVAAKLKAQGYATHQFGKWDAGNASPSQIPVGRGFQSSLGYFDHCNDYYNYRPQTPFSSGVFGPMRGPCPPNQTMIDLWDTDGPFNNSNIPAEEYEEARFSARALSILHKHDPTVPLFFYYAFHIVHTDPNNQVSRFC